MAHTARLTVVAQRIQALLLTKVEDTGFHDPPIRNVFYGDQNKIPRSPTVCVDPSFKRRSWPPTPTAMTENTLEVNILLYHARVTDEQQTKLELDTLSEAVQEFFNVNHLHLEDAGGDPLIVYGYCVDDDRTYVVRSGTLFHASRILWRGITKTQLTVAG